MYIGPECVKLKLKTFLGSLDADAFFDMILSDFEGSLQLTFWLE